MSVRDLRAKFAGNSAPTPENQTKQIKTNEEAQRLAVQIARARAARYNMTLRSLALRATQEQKRLSDLEREKRMAAKAHAAKYNATKRAIMINNARPTKKEDIDNLNRSLNPDLTPAIAREVMEVVALNEMSAEEIVARENKKKNDKKVEEEEPAFEMTNLAKALKEGNGQGIDRGILQDFLETHAPQELKTLDQKMKEYEGRVQELFDYYAEKYPDPMDGRQEGIIKADKEVFGKDAGSKGLKDLKAEDLEDIDDDDEFEAKKSFLKQRDDAYESTIKEAEEGGAKKQRNSMRFEKREKNEMDLEKELDKYKNSKEDFGRNLSPNNEGYILSASLELTDEDDQVQWAVKVKSAQEILEDKLVKQGVPKDKAKNLAKVMEDEENISEMM